MELNAGRAFCIVMVPHGSTSRVTERHTVTSGGTGQGDRQEIFTVFTDGDGTLLGRLKALLTQLFLEEREDYPGPGVMLGRGKRWGREPETGGARIIPAKDLRGQILHFYF